MTEKIDTRPKEWRDRIADISDRITRLERSFGNYVIDSLPEEEHRRDPFPFLIIFLLGLYLGTKLAACLGE
ncbi:MAG: hypothetical protein ACYDAL_16390 [Candidatus Dormibacteraceae bacterium]